ncbi:hypothetical protein Pla108_33680 [Botrimarina colliarenosi]|uniref:DUF1697 domain-containing protein n=1 Tax=Botrimarina colliarenosi TaxID=2528001 RepID=A0A5C6A7C7_9BACT|nr:DUF1697 domain-containing protein [Botrimarina colliarenosi]TWT95225.1 hypothetical protein Pla108_33680 [Botrimarina colliarenosi]
MPTWIVLLRGVNVGGKGKLPMKAWAADLAELGCEEVRTYIQSGNAVLRSSQRSAGRLQAAIGEQLEERHGFRPAVQAYSADQWADAIDDNPFPDAVDDPKSLHAYFLAAKPKAPDMDGLSRLPAPSERYHLAGRVFYLHAPDGVGRSRLAARAEKLLGVEVTARNWRTVAELGRLAEEI